MKPSDYIKKGWTRTAWARNDQGCAVSADDPGAVSWCLIGAIVVSRTERDYHHYRSRLAALMPKRMGCLSDWNDSLKTPRRIIAAMLQVEQELGIE